MLRVGSLPVARIRAPGGFDPLWPLHQVPAAGLGLPAFWPLWRPYLYQDAALTTLVAAHADPIGAAFDVSGHGVHVTQATTAAKPTFDATIGLFGGATFDGGDLLRSGAAALLRNVGEGTLFVVCQTTASGVLSYVMSVDRNTANAPRLGLNQEASGVGTLRAIGRRLDADGLVSLETSAGVFTAGQWGLRVARADYANSNAYIYYNGVQHAATTSFGTDGNTSDTDSAGVSLGGGQSTYMTGQIIAAGIITGAVTEAFLLRMFREWAVPLSRGLIAA